MAVKRHNVHFDVTAQDSSAGVFAAVEKNLAGVKSAGADLAMSLTKGFAALAVAVEGLQVFAAYRDILRANAAMDDFAESTGASVENLSALARVARVSGTSFDFVTESMGRMIKGLKGADEEGQNAAAALQFLDIKAKNADGTFRDQADVMLEVAKKLATYADNGNKVAIVQDLYGKGAQKLLPYLKDLADATDRHATLTTAQAAAAEEAEKNLKRLNLVMEDGRRELVNEYTPALNAFLQRLLAASKATGGLASGIAFMATRPASELFGAPNNPGARLQQIDKEIAAHEQNTNRSIFVADPSKSGYENAYNQAAAQRAAVQPGTIMSKIQIGRLMQEREYLLQVQRDEAMKLAGPGSLDARDLRSQQKFSLDYQSPNKTGAGAQQRNLSPFDTAMLQMRQASLKEQVGPSEFVETSLAIQAGKYKSIDEATGKVRDLTEAEKQLLLATAAERDTQRDLREQRDAMTKSTEESRKAADDYYASLVQQASAMKDLIDPGRQYLHEQEKLNELVRTGLLTQEEAVAAQRKMLEARTKVEDVGKSVDATDEAARQLGLTFQSAFEDAVLAGSELSDVLKALEKDIARIALRKAVTEPLGTAASDFFKGGLGSLGKLFGGDAGTIGTGMKPVGEFGGWFADGGFLKPGQVGIAGEAGPEIIYGGRSGMTVTPSGGGGGAVNIVNNVHVEGKGVTLADVNRAVAAGSRLTVAAIAEARRR